MVAFAMNDTEQQELNIHTNSKRLSPSAALRTRAPHSRDATFVAKLVTDAGTLEVNTTYAYVLLCTHFAETCAVAERAGEIIGCALGYRVPARSNTLFVWQIGVQQTARRLGIGRRLLNELVSRPQLADVQFLETTVAPSNAASRSLFERWATEHGTRLRCVGVFESSLFGSTCEHENEEVLQIGPFRKAI
jgi:L-2,4-diaminobutyric acid acetyltransferase